MSNGNLGVGLSIPVTHPKYADLGASIDNALAAGVDIVELPLHWLDVIVGAHVLKPRVAEVATARKLVAPCARASSMKVRHTSTARSMACG